MVASFHQKPPVINSVSFFSVFSLLLSTFEQLVISESCFLNCELQQTAAKEKEKSDLFWARDCMLTIENLKINMPTPDGNNGPCPVRHARSLCFSCDSGDYGYSEVFENTIIVYGLSHSHCCILYCQFILSPPHRPNGVHTILDAILNLFWCWLLYSWYVFMWVWLSLSQWEHVTDLKKWRREKKEDRRYLYIYSLFTPIHNVGSYTL